MLRFSISIKLLYEAVVKLLLKNNIVVCITFSSYGKFVYLSSYKVTIN